MRASITGTVPQALTATVVRAPVHRVRTSRTKSPAPCIGGPRLRGFPLAEVGECPRSDRRLDLHSHYPGFASPSCPVVSGGAKPRINGAQRASEATRCRAGHQEVASRQAASRLLRCAPALRVTCHNLLIRRAFMAGSQLPAVTGPFARTRRSRMSTPTSCVRHISALLRSHQHPSPCAEYHRPGKAAGGARFPGSPCDMTETAQRHDPGGAIQSLRGRQQRHGLATGRLVARPSRGRSKARRRDHSAGPRPRWRMDDRIRWEGAARHPAVARVPHRDPHWTSPPGWSG